MFRSGTSILKYYHSVSLQAIGLQLLEGHYYDSVAKIMEMHRSRWLSLFSNTNSRSVIVHTFPNVSALSCSESMDRKESKEQCY